MISTLIRYMRHKSNNNFDFSSLYLSLKLFPVSERILFGRYQESSNGLCSSHQVAVLVSAKNQQQVYLSLSCHKGIIDMEFVQYKAIFYSLFNIPL